MAVPMVIMCMRVTMVMAVIVIVVVRVAMRVAVVVSMMVVPKCHHADQVDCQPHAADDEQLAKPLGLGALPQPLKCLKRNLDAQEPAKVSNDSTTGVHHPMTHISRMPLAKPLSVSILPKP